MPKYELMYIVGSHISDDQIPQVTEEVKKDIQESGGIIEKLEDLGKRKLAYPIKKTRNGFYTLFNFSAPADKINDIEHKLRTSQSIIRHLTINIDEDLIRIEKDRINQAKLKLLRPKLETREEQPVGAATKPEKKIQIDLDAEIEKALDSEELK